MAQPIVRGHTITLDLLVFDSFGDAYDPSDVKASIVDANGVTVVNLDAPTAHPAAGHFQYGYAVATDAVLGAWSVKWFGTVDGLPLETDEGFTVQTGPAGAGTSADGTTCSPWATVDDAPASLQTYDIDPLDVNDAYQQASDILYELTGRRYPGRCTDFIRPQAQYRAVEGPPRWWPVSQQWGLGSRWGWCSCNRSRETGCALVPEIRLPGHPVDRTSIVVKVDGIELDYGTEFRLDDGQYLVRVDGQGWPCCQDLRADDTEDQTFSVRYQFGVGPDIGGKMSAILLGNAIFAEQHPEHAAACKVPSRTTSVTRTGTRIDLASPDSLLKAGMTGFPSVDRWITSKLVGRARRRAAVLIPGRHRSARRTNT